MAESVPTTTSSNASRSPLPWVFLALFLVWLGALIWMARGEFTKVRATHERERVLQPQGSQAQ